MSIIQAIILGIIQGVTEFLPISSSGHLILAQNIMGEQQDNIFFDVILHVGTLVAILIVYRKVVLDLLKQPFQKTSYLIILATIPAIIFAKLFNSQLDELLNSGTYLAPCFILTGILLMLSDRYKGNKEIEEMGYLDAFIIGIAQACAILPGLSRSGTTIFAGLHRGLNRAAAAQFSFLMAIPAIAGAALLESVKMMKRPDAMESIHSIGVLPIIFGFTASFIVGFLTINILIALIKKAQLKYFSFYLFGLSGLILIDQFITHIYLK